MVGGYDEIMQPKVVDDRFDHILFSNDIKEDRVGVWQIRPIPYHNDDNTRICRYVKTHPEDLLPEYDFSIWVDSNIQIVSSYVYDHAIDLYQQGTLLSSMCHPIRDCIYDEAFEVMFLCFEQEKIVVEWCRRLRKENYPEHNGLHETGVMFRKHNTSLVRETNVMWWDCIEKYSKRDQLSFNYALWKLGIECDYFLEKGYCVRNSDSFVYMEHKNIGKKVYLNTKKYSWLLRYCWKNQHKEDVVKRYYMNIYASLFPYFWIGMLGQYYRFKEICKRNIRRLKIKNK